MRKSRKGESSFVGSDTSDDVENLDLYEATAKYYDIWTEDFQEDIKFYLQLAARTGGPVLECMSGTGRVLIPFAREGYEITGVDRSPAMLDVCSTKVAFEKPNVEARIEIVQGDVRDFKADRKFKLAFVPYNSFLHLLDTKDQEAALKNIRDHLAEDGLFSFSVFAPRLDRPEHLLRHRGTKLSPQGEIISWFEAQTFDQPNQRTTVTYFYDISRQDRPVRRITTVFTLRYMFCREVTELLQRCGFEVESVFGDYKGGELRSGSELMVFVARKK